MKRRKICFRGRALVVDDEPELAAVLEIILVDEGFEVVIRESGEAAVDTMAHEKFDFVLTDFKLGKMTGAEVILRGRKLQGTKTVFVLMTGNIDNPDFGPELQGAEPAVLYKPFSHEELAGFLKKFPALASVATPAVGE